MGGSRIFDWGGLRIVKVRDDGKNVALFALKSWPIGGGHGPVAPPLEPPMIKRKHSKNDIFLALILFSYHQSFSNFTCF